LKHTIGEPDPPQKRRNNDSVLSANPVVFFDNRNVLDANFLRILASAKIDNDIIVIVTSPNHKPLKTKNNVSIVDAYSLPGYREYENKFLGVYQHLSTNTQEFETSCFLRFFAAECLIKKMQLERIWMFDCDVWPTNSISFWNDARSDYLSPDYFDERTISCHSSLLSSALLRQFNKFTLEVFYNEMIPELQERFEQIKSDQLSGGISDMTAMGLFLRNYSNYPWLDSNINGYSEHFLSHTFSRLYLDLNKTGKSYVLIVRARKNFFVISGLKYRRYATLHFQGNAKHLIPVIQRFRFLWGNQKLFSIMIRVSRKCQKIFSSK